jgi:hypothetical protein
MSTHLNINRQTASNDLLRYDVRRISLYVDRLFIQSRVLDIVKATLTKESQLFVSYWRQIVIARIRIAIDAVTWLILLRAQTVVTAAIESAVICLPYYTFAGHKRLNRMVTDA